MTRLADVIMRGLAADRPAAGVEGRLYYSTDTGVLERDNGTTWDGVEGTASGAGAQPADADLTAIAGLTPSNDDVIQRKAGAWTNRTPAQLKTDLALAKGDVGLGNVDNTSNATERAAAATLTNKTLTTPTIGDFTNAGHSHQNAAGGGGLAAAAITSGVLAIARLASGTPDGTKFVRDDGTLAVPAGTGFANPMTTQDDLIVGGSSGAAARLAKGTDGQVLTVDPTTHHLVWATPSTGFANPMTTAGDLILGGSSGTPGRLAKGTDSYVLTVDPTTHLPVWATPSGGGAALTVEEVDGSPTDSAVTKIKFPNGTLAIASHVATYTPVSPVVVDEIVLAADQVDARFPVSGSLPTGYAAWRLLLSGRMTTAAAGDDPLIQLNGDTGGNYDYAIAVGGGSVSNSSSTSQTSIRLGPFPGSTNGAGNNGASEVLIFDPEDTTRWKSVHARADYRDNGPTLYNYHIQGHWRSTAAITSISIKGNLKAGMRLTLIGIPKLASPRTA